MIKIFSIGILVLFVMFTKANAQEIPEEFFLEFQLHDNNASNDEIAISLDKFIYNPSDMAELFGYVMNYKSGVKMFIEIKNPLGVIQQESVGVTSDGVFQVIRNIPEDAVAGTYVVTVNYGGRGIPITLTFDIAMDMEKVFVQIPLGAAIQENSISFLPQDIIVKAGVPIFWINNDEAPHTVVSGKKGIAGKIFSDGRFDSGIFGPNDSFSISLSEGKYDYFCRLHPWLRGTVFVSPSTDKPVNITPKETERVEPIEYFTLSDSENLSDWSSTACDSCTTEIILSEDKKEGFSSVRLLVKGHQNAEGSRASFDLEFEAIDITSYDNIILWVKTKGSAMHDSRLALSDSDGKHMILQEFNSNRYPSWSEISIPLHQFISQDEGFSKNSVSSFVILSPKGNLMKLKQLEIFIDNIRLTRILAEDIPTVITPKLTISTNKKDYILTEKIIVSGQIQKRESDQPVTLKVLDPLQNLVSIEQIIPHENQYNFTMSALNKQFSRDGLYKIIAQYGTEENKAETTFNLLIPKKVGSWLKNSGYNIYESEDIFYAVPYGQGEFESKTKESKGFSIILNASSLEIVKEKINKLPKLGPYLVTPDHKNFKVILFGSNFYAIPADEGNFDFAKFREGSYSETFAATSLDDIILVIDSKDILNSFLIPAETLLEVWNDREDLKQQFPEVEQGILQNLIKWAETTGWNEDPRLSLLIPEGSIPPYEQEVKIKSQPITQEPSIMPKSDTTANEPDDESLLVLQMMAPITVAIAGFMTYLAYTTSKKSHRSLF